MRSNNSSDTTAAPLFLRVVTPAFFSNIKKIQSPGTKNVFILSTGRTGTKYLADLLNQLDGVVAVHEPKPSRVLQAWSSAYAEGKISDSYMCSVFTKKRRKLFVKHQAEIYIESNHFIDGFVSHIPELVENVEIVHIVRDPRDFITSMINRGNDSGWKLYFNKFVPYWAYREPGYHRWTMTPIEREALHWAGMNRLLDNYSEDNKNYHFFKFEELFNSEALLKKFFSICGLSTEQISKLNLEKAEKNRSRLKGTKAMSAWRDWSKEDCKKVDAICGDLMRKYGYGYEKEWLERLR